jgi:hypothetical protein
MATGLFVVGVLGLGFAAVAFAVTLFARVDSLSLQMLTTMPTLFGIGAILSARAMAGAPTEVAVGPGGLTLVERGGPKSYRWEQIGWASVGQLPLSQRRQLTLYDPEGKPIVKLDESLEGFDALVQYVTARIATRGDDTAERIRLQKARRSAVFNAVGGVLFLALAGANAWNAHNEQRAARLLKEAAVPGTAQIKRRFLAPNGVTPRLEYEIATPGGKSATRNAEVRRFYWDALARAKTVPVRYVPTEPEISRLAFGEPPKQDPSDQPRVLYGLSALVALMSLVFIAGAVLAWRGWDITLDSKTGRVSIKQFGSGG